MELSIIFVNWNSADYLRECVKSIYRYTVGIVFEVIIVDNASLDQGLEGLAENFPAAKIIRSREN